MKEQRHKLKACSVSAAAITAGLLLFGTPAAFAGSFTDIGVVYNLSSSLLSSTQTTQTFNVTLTANATGYTGSSTDLLDSVAIKVDIDSSIVSESLLSGPSDWTFVDGGTNGSGTGCKMSGNGFDCSQGGSVSKDLGVGSKSGNPQPYAWVFILTVNSGTLFSSGASIKAQYLNSAGDQQVNLTSVTGTNSITTPEPASMALLVTALFGACGLLRRKLLA